MDGKPVEHGMGEHISSMSDGAKSDKVSALVEEYTFLLTSQLESQRIFFEKKLVDLEKQHRTDLREVKQDVVTERKEREKLVRAMQESKKNADLQEQKLQAKLAKAMAQIQQLKKEIEFLQNINDELSSNQEKWKTQIKRAETEKAVEVARKQQQVEDLEGQVRDLMLHLETTRTLEEQASSSGGIEDGDVITVTDPSPTKRKMRKKK
eukprot:TRINITY_DN6755_c0_g1_i2.p3 TRINITY_DN6755_c0_g1~~TRINITY_DN6755_c0_g1_i2.p3  ORF type:complete len:208 (-),score=70.38 TRINITY_DN6755_c0_g1_i2:162-785(-)